MQLSVACNLIPEGAVLIQGPKQPGNDIDVYLRPLVDELLQLWSVSGVRVWDEHEQKEFDL